MMSKHLNDWTRKEFEALPHRENWHDEVECDCIVILPMKDCHDSGYRNLDFVAVSKGVPICRLAGGSDVVHLDGIGGLGHHWLERFGCCPRTKEPVGWSIDCLKKSGLLSIFGPRTIIAGNALSSFEVFAKIGDKNE